MTDDGFPISVEILRACFDTGKRFRLRVAFDEHFELRFGRQAFTCVSVLNEHFGLRFKFGRNCLPRALTHALSFHACFGLRRAFGLDTCLWLPCALRRVPSASAGWGGTGTARGRLHWPRVRLNLNRVRKDDLQQPPCPRRSA